MDRLIKPHSHRFWALLPPILLVISSQILGVGLPLNESEIKFEGTDEYRYKGGPTICNTYPFNNQLLEDPIRLTEIGLQAKEIEKGANCLAGDFDRNGYLDFLFWKGAYLVNNQKYKAVFFHQNKVQYTKLVSSDEKYSYWASSYRYGRNQTVHSITNISGIKLGSALFSMKGYGLCRISRDQDYGLQQIGLKHEALISGTICLVEDLDANGYYDFVFTGPFDRDALYATDDMKKREALSPKIMILFFQKEKLIQTQIIANHGYDHIDVYGRRDTKGEFGEPITKVPGLIQYGEGGTTTIYLYNKKTKLMEPSEYSSEWD